ncbi:MAG TPA: hypothetical protein VN174_00860 [Candidatus Methanoperedens sp.]|nr:hypothetical protein [Candidatus Methanoperedens sp.]
MNITKALLVRERQRSLNWLKDNTATKLFVIFAFFLVILGIIFAEYKITSIYLSFINNYPPFGPAIALYSLKVAVFMLFIFAIISSTVISLSTLYQSPSLTHLFTLPISPTSIYKSKFIPGWISSLFVLLLIFPLFYIYNKYIFKSGSFFIVVSLGLIILSTVSQALGTIISTTITFLFGKINRKKQLFVFISMFAAFAFLIKLLFPSGLYKLYDSTNYSSFQNQLDSFPLMGKLLPTNWLVDALGGNFNLFSLFVTLVTVVALLVLVREIGNKYYLSAWRHAQNQSFLASNNSPQKVKSFFPKILDSKNIYYPLIINDVLSLLRSSKEVNYTVFLGSMLLILVLSIKNLVILKDTTQGLLFAIYLIAFVSTTLIFLISAIRSIFPLVARERGTSWFSFTLPISRKKYLFQKVIFSFLVGFPSILVSVLVVSGLRLAREDALIFVLFMSLTIILNNLIQCLFGAINPNFKESDNSDAISTSSQGIAGLILSLFVIVVSTIQLNGYFHSNIDGWGLLLRWSITAIITLLPTSIVAIKSTKKYSL